MKKKLFYLISILFISGCNFSEQKPLITYDRASIRNINSFKIYNNVIYIPTLKSNYILDEEIINEASGYYKIINPSQDKINRFISEGYIIYQNESGEIIIYV